MSVVGKAIKGVSKAVFGGGQSVVQGSNYGQMSDEEFKRISDIEAEIERMFGEQGTLQGKINTQSQEAQSLFANSLNNFLSGGSVNPEVQKQNAAYVDQLFTQPAQAAINQNVADFTAQANAKAAAMGRSPNLDIATQQAIAGEGIRQNLGLQLERGNRIQDLQKQQLDTGMKGTGFLNDLGQRALNNRMGLLNARSGLAEFYQRERSKTGAGVQTSPGLLGQFTSGVGQIGGAQGALGKLGGIIGFK